MINFNNYINKLEAIVESPKKQMEKYINDGKTIIGCFPPYTPEILIDAADAIPIGVWGTSTKESILSKTYLPAFACPIMHYNLELGLSGDLNMLSAIVIPTLCDVLRCMSQNWKYAIKDIPMIPITFPQKKGEFAEQFLVSEYEMVIKKLEKITGNLITEESINSSIQIYNEHKKMMREFEVLANKHLNIITPTKRYIITKSAWFMCKKEHIEILREINKFLKSQKEVNWDGKKIMLTGIIAEPKELMEILENNNFGIVGNDLAHVMRQYKTDIPKRERPLQSVAAEWIEHNCSLFYDVNKNRILEFKNQAISKKADGVIACIMKFCDPEEYDYPIIQEEFNSENIPVLQIEIAQKKENMEQIRTRIEAFSEMINQ